MIDKSRLEAKSAALGILLTGKQLDALDRYAEILVAYNEKVNLTAITDAVMDFARNVFVQAALMGVPDYIPRSMTEGKITVMPNAFGSFGEGLLNVSRVRTGAVTILRLAEEGGKLHIHAAKATAKTPPKWEEAGWAPPAPQLPSIEAVFDFPAQRFLDRVAAQHYIVAYGDITALLAGYCKIAGIGFEETK